MGVFGFITGVGDISKKKRKNEEGRKPLSWLPHHFLIILSHYRFKMIKK
jgi:hypothetical protein